MSRPALRWLSTLALSSLALRQLSSLAQGLSGLALSSFMRAAWSWGAWEAWRRRWSAWRWAALRGLSSMALRRLGSMAISSLALSSLAPSSLARTLTEPEKSGTEADEQPGADLPVTAASVQTSAEQPCGQEAWTTWCWGPYSMWCVWKYAQVVHCQFVPKNWMLCSEHDLSCGLYTSTL